MPLSIQHYALYYFLNSELILLLWGVKIGLLVIA